MRSLKMRLRKRAGLLALCAGLAATAAGVVPHSVAPTAQAATTFIVNSTGDASDASPADGVCNDGSGNCTLRAAIQEANAAAGADTINFNIPGAGVHTIAPATALPAITGSLVIDGYTQPGSSRNTLADGDNAVLLIELSGANINTSGGAGADGLVLTNNGTYEVYGLVINRFTLGSGLVFEQCQRFFVQGNFIGTDPTGQTRAGNLNGVKIGANTAPNPNNISLVGGFFLPNRNIISGNTGNGVMTERNASLNLIGGNFIGVDATGRRALGNGSHGVFLGTGSNRVGVPQDSAANVISGNGQAGVMIQPNVSTANNIVDANHIGTDVTGSFALPNFFGVWINFGNANTVGGPEPSSGNLISGNTASGVLITGSSRNNQVSGNRIGTDATATRPLGNGRHGVEIADNAALNAVQPQGSSPANTIAFNAGNGVAVLAVAVDNAVRRNNIFSNGQLGIDLNGDGVTPNDTGDLDRGANDSQNFPLITSVVANGSSTTVQGAFSTRSANLNYNIDLFTNSGCDQSGHGEGARYFGSTAVTTDGGGHANFSVTVPFALPAGRVITATATDSTSTLRNTSEFSPCSSASATGQVAFAAAAYNVNEDIGNLSITLVRTGGSTGPLSVNFETADLTATAPSDYTSATTTVTFADGETTKTLTVPIINDGVTEPDESLALILSNTADPDAVGAPGRATININDASKRPSVTITDVVVNEPLSGQPNAVFNVTLSAMTGQLVGVNFETADGTATAPSDYTSTSGALFFAPGETSAQISVSVNGDTVDELTENFFVNLTGASGATITDAQGVGTIINNATPVLQFSASNFSADEGDNFVSITVSRSGQTGGVMSIGYAVTDGTASERKDYTTALGTLRFGQHEMSKTFNVLLADDGFQEGPETVNLALSNPTGVTLAGRSTAVLTINDNDPTPSATNPIDASEFFVRQHYHDFLNREPDAAGLQFWTNNIESCGADQSCRERKRIDTSAAFFLSIEFQGTGFFVQRAYDAAFVRLPRLREFLRDTQEIGRDIVVGETGWEAKLEAKKEAFVAEFVSRAEFRAAFPDTMTVAQFVDKLNTNTGGSLSTSERDALVNGLNAGTEVRHTVLRKVIENANYRLRQQNRAFVLMQYFGYLRRNPDDTPDTDLAGFNFWLGKLVQFGGDFRAAEMVKSFLVAGEYRARFR